MKLGFFGTPEHSAFLLRKLHAAGHEISFAVSNPDRPAGRKKELLPTPVKKAAIDLNIPILQYEQVKSEAAVKEITTFATDLNVVFAFGSIIPEEIFNKPPLGTINLHGSLLPKLRGASPVQSAILQGFTITGVTIQYIAKELDAGNIISQKEIRISPDDNSRTLLQKLTEAGTEEILMLIKNPSREKFTSIPQDHSKASYCKKITPADRKLEFGYSATDLHNRIRAFSPDNTPYALFRGKKLLIHSSSLKNETSGKDNVYGRLNLVDRKTLFVECGEGTLLYLEKLQPENKNQMPVADFINGYKPTTGELLS
ncbi:MAG: methionyl-tRNA formyltransferase [Leptospira sp.]|nr:methionyl-tRNA formyltransferase [Leptospira sp.]